VDEAHALVKQRTCGDMRNIAWRMREARECECGGVGSRKASSSQFIGNVY
jgi:hypothetical protein